MGPISEHRKLKCAKAKWLALKQFLDYFEGNMAAAARAASVSRVTVHKWREQGWVGMVGALRIHYNPDCPFTRTMLRPDLKPEDWRRARGMYDPGWTKGLIAEQDRVLADGHK